MHRKISLLALIFCGGISAAPIEQPKPIISEQPKPSVPEQPNLSVLEQPNLSRPAQPYLGKFQLLTLSPLDKNLIIGRCNTQTGEAWYRLASKWYKAVESEQIGESVYTCATQTFGTNGWVLVRMDLNSGRIWTLQGEVWRKVLD